LNWLSHSSLISLVKFGLTTHRNGLPDNTSPLASSWNLITSKTVELPNATYMTEPGACFSSQVRQVWSSDQKLPVSFDIGATNGPMGNALGRRANASGFYLSECVADDGLSKCHQL